MRTSILSPILVCTVALVPTLGFSLSLTPDPLVLEVGQTKNMQVSIDLPAPPSGQEVLLVITGVDATAPSSVFIVSGELSADFLVTGGITIGQGTITAYAGSDFVPAEIHVVEPPVFSDDFETGDASRWSASFPPTLFPSVYDLQDDSSPSHPAEGSRVTVTGVTCSAIDTWDSGAGGFWIQESAGGMYSGIHVVNLSGIDVSALSVSSIVAVTGTYQEFFGESQIILESVALVSSGTAPLPELVLPSDVATGQPYAEAYEGVLVEIGPVTVTTAPDQYGEFVVTGGLLVDDDLYEIVPAPQVGNTYSSLVGVMRYSFDNTKLEPRFAADIVPSGPDDPLINEFVNNHTGSDTYEFVEIFGDPNTDYSAYTILEIEGDTGRGAIDGVFPAGTTDPNGFWTTGFVNSEIENGTVTLLLVEGFTGTIGDDIDSNDDGVIDTTYWSSIVDDIAVDDGGGGDLTYSASVLAPGFGGDPYTVGGASRIPNGADTDTTADWMRNDFDGAGLPGFTGTPLSGEAYNTPGSTNQAVP